MATAPKMPQASLPGSWENLAQIGNGATGYLLSAPYMPGAVAASLGDVWETNHPSKRRTSGGSDRNLREMSMTTPLRISREPVAFSPVKR